MAKFLTARNIIMVLSLILNVLGGTGTVPPLVGGPVAVVK